MPAPAAALDYLGMWRTEVREANLVRGPLGRNAHAHAQNILALIEPSPAVGEALGKAIKVSGRLVAATQEIYRSDAGQTERAEALSALDAVEKALEGARPSATARNLGLA